MLVRVVRQSIKGPAMSEANEQRLEQAGVSLRSSVCRSHKPSTTEAGGMPISVLGINRGTHGTLDCPNAGAIAQRIGTSRAL